MTTLEPSNILDILRTRQQHCRSLLDLSSKQRLLIDQSDYTQLLTILGQKQRILGRLDEINKQHPDLKSRWQEIRELGDPGWREDCEHILAETESIFAELIEEEQQSTDHLTKRRDDTKNKLQAVSTGAQVHEAYRDSLAPSTHRHLNIDQ